MKYTFPAGFYGDVRIEDVSETMIQATLGTFDEMKERSYRAAFVRLFDGNVWYYASTTDESSIQSEIARLAALGTANPDIEKNPVVRLLETNTGESLRFQDVDVQKIPFEKKIDLLKSYYSLIDGQKYVGVWRANYVDQRKTKSFISSKGADLIFDTQRTGFRVGFELSAGEKKFRGRYDFAHDGFDSLDGKQSFLKENYHQAADFLKTSKNVEPGEYPVILSPMAAGVFAHESFGHKSEADFMIGDETMKAEWQIGKKVGARLLSIVEDGQKPGAGYVPYDDEGTRARENFLIKEGELAGRLHSSTTAASLGEGLTGNARSKDFEFEPIVRMTTTYIKEGTDTLDDLIAGIGTGVLVETINHGSGMSTFTMAPSLSYMIRNGKKAEPVRVSVVSGDVFTALSDIDGLSDTVELLSFILGGCGKMEQSPLPVGFGGPWVRVKKLTVR